MSDYRISKEEIARRIGELSLDSVRPSISPEQWRYRERAALRMHYDLAELQPTDEETNAAERKALQKVLAESSMSFAGDQPLWELWPAVRRQALQRLAGEGRLRAALDANPPRHDSILQQRFSAVIRGDAPWPAEPSLQQLEATLQAVRWLAGCLPDLPAEEELQRRIAQERLLKPFHFLVGDHFRGRVMELCDLRLYMGDLEHEDECEPPSEDKPDLLELGRNGDLEQAPPLLVYGPGGIGKSTLIARFILEHIEGDKTRRMPFVYIDCNRRDIEINQPAAVLLEAVRQLEIQYPQVENTWQEAAEVLQGVVDAAGVEPEGVSTLPGKGGSFTRRGWRRAVGFFADAVSGISNEGSPLLFVLDTVEELLYLPVEQLAELWRLLVQLSQKVPHMRLLLSGRSPMPVQFPTVTYQLEGLAPEVAVEILQARGVADPALAQQIVDSVGTSPFSLWLTANLYKRLMEEEADFEDAARRQEFFAHLKDHLIQGRLYRRILGHIRDERVKALAHPGMVLRRFTKELILEVLAGPTEIEVADLDDARQLLEALRKETSLIDIETATASELRQRPELRQEMLQLLNQDDEKRVQAIHVAAIKYFDGVIETARSTGQKPQTSDEADLVYHRLASGDPPAFLDSYAADLLQAIIRELGSNIRDLPDDARIRLTQRARIEIHGESEVLRLTSRDELLQPFPRAIDFFVNRNRELEILQRFVEGDLADGDLPVSGGASVASRLDLPLVVSGPGGIGKTWLILRFLSHYASTDGEQARPYVYMNLGQLDPAFDMTNSILLEAGRQLASQHPEGEALWRDWLEEMRYLTDRELSRPMETLITESRRLDRAASRLAELAGARLESEPLLLVLDDLEELLYRGIEQFGELWQILERLSYRLPQLRVVFVGRAQPPANYPVFHLRLDGLDDQAVEMFFLQNGIEDRAVIQQIISTVGRNPLSLSLAADIYMESGLDEEAGAEYFSDLSQNLIQGALYERILGRIHDRRVVALARSSPVLLRLTPETIFHILAEPAGIDVPDLDEAFDLYNQLRQEVSLVEFDELRSGELRIRADVRASMLELLIQDNLELVRQIHLRAADYYRVRNRQAPDGGLASGDLAGEVYHRLAMGESPQFLDEFSLDNLQSIADELNLNIQDLPLQAQTYLVARVSTQIHLDDSAWREADQASWEDYTARGVANLLDLGQNEQALARLAERRERSAGSKLFALEVQALLRLQRYDAARVVLVRGIEQTPAPSPESLVLQSLAGELYEAQGTLRLALDSYRQGRKIAAQLSDETDETIVLHLQLNILRLARVLSGPEDTTTVQEYDALIESWQAVDDKRLAQHPDLVREAVGLVCTESPSLVRRAVRLVGFGQQKPGNLSGLAGALASWDHVRSAGAKVKPGLLARSVSSIDKEGLSLFTLWPAYLQTNPWKLIAEDLAYLVDTYPLTPAMSITLAGLIGERLFLSGEQAELLQTILYRQFTLAELEIQVREKLGADMADISGQRKRQKIQDLISWAETEGRLLDLIKMAAAAAALYNKPMTDLLRRLRIDYVSLMATATGKQPTKYSISTINSIGELVKANAHSGLTTEAAATAPLSAICRMRWTGDAEGGAVAAGFLVAPDLVLTSYDAAGALLAGKIAAHEVAFHFDSLADTHGTTLSFGRAYALATSAEAAARHETDKPWLVHADEDAGFMLLRLARPAGEEALMGGEGRRGWFKLTADSEASPDMSLSTMVLTPSGNRVLSALMPGEEVRIERRSSVGRRVTGAPLIDVDGRVIGLVHEEKQADARFLTVAPARLVVQALERAGLQ